ncbi:MAG: hypothetical protein ACJ0NC_00460 [Candidatus Marivariicella sp.]
MTKASIVQRLLDKKKITAEEASVILLQGDTYIPPSYPMYTPNPYYDTPNTTPPPVWYSTDTLNTPSQQVITGSIKILNLPLLQKTKF